MTDIEIGTDRERRRILTIIENERAIYHRTGHLHISHALDALAAKVELDHREDSER